MISRTHYQHACAHQPKPIDIDFRHFPTNSIPAFIVTATLSMSFIYMWQLANSHLYA